MSSGRGERFIAQQLADMEAAGLGGPEAMDPAKARQMVAKAARGPQWRERWRVVIGAVLLVGGIGMWLGAHLVTVPALTSDRALLTEFDTSVRAENVRAVLQILGIFAAVPGLVWLGNQVWARRRTCDSRDVRRAWVTAALLAVGVALWALDAVADGLGPSAMFLLVVVTMQSWFITHTTGPDSVRDPGNDARAAMYQALTPWPVVLGVSVAFCVVQAVALLR